MKKPNKKATTYWLYGRHAVLAACANPQRHVRRVWFSGRVRPEGVSEAIPAQAVEPVQLHKVCGKEAVHQGIAAEVDPLNPPDLSELAQSGARLWLLDRVSDPHNIGAMMRTAAAFGIAALILPRDHAPGESAVMAKAACGALEQVPLVPVTNLSKAMQELKTQGFWLIGLDGQAKDPVSRLKEFRPQAVVFGAEGSGLRRLTRESCDMLLSIPIRPEMESLNVSNAAAIIGYIGYETN